MELSLYQIDAFSHKVFGGNPAAICPLDYWLDDEILLKIAQENNLAETAYFVETEEGFHLRWFTPELEMDLCGHATLAASHVIFEHLSYQGDIIKFTSMSGVLQVVRNGEQLTMDFPVWEPVPAVLPDIIQKAIGRVPQETLKSRDYILRYNSIEDILAIDPDENLLKTIDLGTGGIVVTAPGTNEDFVSRFFTPGAAVFEDPVTGSAHCTLAPYWAEQLGKQSLTATQLSSRKGQLKCDLKGNRVLISGYATTYLIGKFRIN